MEYQVDAPEFVAAGQRVTVTIGGPFAGPRLFVDGLPATKQGSGYAVPGANGGESVLVRLKGAGVDAVPVAEVNGRTVRLAPPLAWYEYGWAYLPILLLIVGGAVGGLLGATAAYLNLYQFRAQKTPVARYGVSFAFTLGAALIYGVFALLLRAALHSAHR